MSDKPIPPYTALLPTILCQQPAVILHWLKTERATGNLPVEVALDCIIEVLSRQNPNLLYFDGSTYIRGVAEGDKLDLEAQLEVYKRAVKHTLAYIKQYEDQIPSLSTAFVKALHAVDKLEGK